MNINNMDFSKLIKLVQNIFPGSEVIEEIKITQEEKISEAGRILSNSRKTKKNLIDKNQLDLI